MDPNARQDSHVPVGGQLAAPVPYVRAIRNAFNERPVGMMFRIRRAMNGWLEYRRTIHQLSRLPDRQLSDIGVFRNDIKSLARQRRAQI